MKRYTLFFIALLFVCPFFSTAQKVKIEEASELAKIVFNKYNSGRLTKTKNIIPLGSSTKTDIGKTDTLLYIVSFEAGGYAIISGDKGAPPYLGYCPKGDFQEPDLPPGLIYLLEKYKNKMSRIIKDKISQNEDIKKRWEEIYDQYQLKSVTSNVAPMLDTEWGQRYGYNDSIPNNYAAGCTAVAMAQILRYWECRVNPTGNLTWVWNGLVSHANFGATTYGWLDMDDDDPNPYNAQLIYHAGVSCLTKYKTTTSASSTPGRARDGFVDYWGMDNNADVKWRMWHLSNWKDMLVDELHDGRPILYSAGGAEIGDDLVYGHSWVIDGVTVDHNYFWCNWGWYGDYNGWYELGGFDPIDDNFNQMESAIFDVCPVQQNGVATPQLSDQTFTYSSNGYNLTMPQAFGATSYEWITNHGTITGSGKNVTLHTDCSATVQVRAYNEICDIYSSYDAANITINYGPISVSDLICYSGTTASIQNVPNTTITWGGTNVSYPNGNTGTSVTVRAATSSTSGSGTITASFNICGTTKTISKTVSVGPPPVSYITDPVGIYNPVSFYAMPSPNYSTTDSYTWIVSPDAYIYSWMDHAEITFPEPNTYYIGAKATNTCGSSNWAYKYFMYEGDYLMSPNPASTEVEITISAGQEEGMKSASLSSDDEYLVTILDNYGVEKIQKKYYGKKFTVPVNSLKDGNYFVKISNEKINATKQLIIKR